MVAQDVGLDSSTVKQIATFSLGTDCPAFRDNSYAKELEYYSLPNGASMSNDLGSEGYVFHTGECGFVLSLDDDKVTVTGKLGGTLE